MSVNELHEALIGKVALRHDLPKGPVTQPPTEGVENWVWVVGGPAERYVVRVPRASSSTAGFEREAWCSAMATTSGVPTPEILDVGYVDGVPYSLQAWVDGESGDSIRSSELWRTLGRYTRQLSSVPLRQAPDGLFSRFGRDPELAWQRHVQYNLSELIPGDRLIELGVYPAHLSGRLRLLFERVGSLDCVFGLVHGDLAVRNVIVEKGGAHRATLIDWGCAGVGPTPHLEVLSLLRKRDERNEVTDVEIDAFVDGFDADVASVLSQVRQMRILQAFDLARWAVDKCPERLDAIVASARRLVREGLR